MLKKYQLTVFALLLVNAVFAQKVNVKKAMDAALLQTAFLVKNVDSARIVKPNLVSPRTVEKGQFKMVISRDWTSGFFPAQLWLYYNIPTIKSG